MLPFAPSVYLNKKNVGSGFGESEGDGLANAAGAARDEGSVAFERKHVEHAACCHFLFFFYCPFLLTIKCLDTVFPETLRN